jgi:predicted metal-dependent peptidase
LSLNLEPAEPFEYYVEKIQTAIHLLEEDDKAAEDDSYQDENNQVNNTQDDNTQDENTEDDQIEMDYNIEKTHNIWEDSSDIDEKAMVEFTEKAISYSEKGEIPSYLKSMILGLKNSKGELPWNLYLKRIMGTVSSNPKKTITRRDRRQPDRLDLRGQLRSHKANILVALDISGSISEEEFKQAMKEVLSIVKNSNHEITVIECDNQIRRVYKVKSDRDLKERINKKGATRYNPVFEYANQKKVNLLIYFTDGKGEDKLQVIPRGYGVLWIISGGGDRLSLKEPYGAVKKLSNIRKKDILLDVSDVASGGYSMNNQERIL